MKFQVSKANIAVIALATVLLAGGAVAAVYGLPAYRAVRAESALMARIESNPDAKEAYATVSKLEAEKAADPTILAPYVTIGNNWVLIADLLQDQYARDKAIAEYERGIAVSEGKNSVVILNAGNAYRASGRFTEAEAKYKQVIELDPGEPNGYNKLVELYRIDMKKPPEEILPVFQKALETLVDNTRTVQELADYLVSIGRYENAVGYYELLAKKYPEQFSSVLADLEVKVAELKR